jgi:hypothetical protein
MVVARAAEENNMCNAAAILQPCPWCLGNEIKIFVGGDLEYAQCMNCTACGPDHKNGRHWNDVPNRLREAREDAEYFRRNRDEIGALWAQLKVAADRPLLSGEHFLVEARTALDLPPQVETVLNAAGTAASPVYSEDRTSVGCETCPSCGKTHNRQCDDGWHI